MFSVVLSSLVSEFVSVKNSASSTEKQGKSKSNESWPLPLPFSSGFKSIIWLVVLLVFPLIPLKQIGNSETKTPAKNENNFLLSIWDRNPSPVKDLQSGGKKGTGTSTNEISLSSLVVILFSLPYSPSKSFSSLHLTNIHVHHIILVTWKIAFVSFFSLGPQTLKEMNGADQEWLLCIFRETA